MAIPPTAALHILETETTLCEEGSVCANPDHDTHDAAIDDYSTGDYVVLVHDMYCHNCEQSWSVHVEYRA